MASEKLKKILEMSKNIDKKSNKTKSTPQRPIRNIVSLGEQISNADKAIANIDSVYNSPYIPTQEEKEAWNTERGREELTEMADNNIFLEKLKQSKLPAAIVESMKQNPCNYDPSVVNTMMGPENELFKKLNEAYGKDKEASVSGVKAVQKINEQLEKRDKQNVSETITINDTPLGENGSTSIIDFSLLEEVIERVIDRKLSTLNESVSKRMPSSIKSMMLTENGNFRFLDTQDNVYECQMKYLGKKKKKRK